MKELVLKAVSGIVTLGVVLCTINSNAQNLPEGKACRQSFASMQKNKVMLKSGNVHAHVQLCEYLLTINSMQGKDKSEFQASHLIPLMDSTYRWSWDTLANIWEFYPYEKMVDVVYNASNLMLSYTEKSWNGATWVNDYNSTNTYDIHNNLSTSLEQTWNGTAWVNAYLDTYTYDANNNMTNDMDQSWNSGAWANSVQTTYVYDANGNQTNELDQNWNGTMWWNSTRYIYTYDANNNQTSCLMQNWGGMAWANSEMVTYTYDANNYRIGGLSQTWNGSAWTVDEQGIYDYDTHYNLSSILIQRWNGSSWINYMKESFTYDANDFSKSQAMEEWNSIAAYIEYGDSAYDYFHTVMGLNDITGKSQHIVVYPNPATYNITIESPQQAIIEILNIQGQMILQRQLQQGKTNIDISSLAKGVYILRLCSNDKTEVTRIVKE